MLQKRRCIGVHFVWSFVDYSRELNAWVMKKKVDRASEPGLDKVTLA